MKIVKKHTTYFINPKDEEERKLIDKYVFSEIELKEITEKVACLIKTEENTETKEINTKQKITALLNDKSLDFKNKLEGRFEKLLNKKDLAVFKEMVEKKEIVLDKLSNKYKNFFYKVNNKSQSKETMDEKFEEFKKKEHVIFSQDSLAQKFSQTFTKQLQSGEIRGTKSFDRCYYVVSSSVFDKLSDQILKQFEKDFTIKEVAEKLKVSEDLIKCVLEILKEECSIIERRKGVYYKV